MVAWQLALLRFPLGTLVSFPSPNTQIVCNVCDCVHESHGIWALGLPQLYVE